MKTNLTPQIEKVKKPRAKKVVDQETLAATASTITRKRESAKRIRVAPLINVPLESTFARAENNKNRDLEEISVPVINPEYGTLIDPNDFEASQNRIKEAEESGEITLLEEVGTDEAEEKGEIIKIMPRIESMGRTSVPYYEQKPRAYEKYPENKIGTERDNRGWLGKFWDKVTDYVAPKDLYDEDEETEKFTALGQQYEKEQEEKAAQEHKLRYSAPDILSSKIDSKDDDQFSGRMAA